MENENSHEEEVDVGVRKKEMEISNESNRPTKPFKRWDDGGEK